MQRLQWDYEGRLGRVPAALVDPGQSHAEATRGSVCTEVTGRVLLSPGSVCRGAPRDVFFDP